ncbi:MAG TPA: hypothetical protein VGW57_13480 [Chthoniobacterales bacterium]|nr:hypothetical protein [Chthoniobacterales bacterium]
MRFITFIRLATLLTAGAYALASIPSPWHVWLVDRLEHASEFHTTVLSEPVVAQYGLYLTALVAVVLAFVAVPQQSWGSLALSWCFLAMGICLLVEDLQKIYVELRGDFGVVYWLVRCARDACFALPPLILAAVLRYPFVRERLSSPPLTDATSV